MQVFRSILWAVMAVIGAALGIASVGAAGFVGAPVFDLIAQAAIPAALLGFALGAVLWSVGWRALARIWLGAAIVFALPPAVLAPAPFAPPAGQVVQVYFHNIRLWSADAAIIAAQTNAVAADVVVLAENFNPTPGRFAALDARYPFHIQVPRHKSTGEFTVYSRWPIRPAPTTAYDDPRFFLMSIDTPGGPFTLIAAHPQRPWPFFDATVQRGQIETVLSWINPAHPTVLIGDFNAVPWAWVGRRLRAAGLRAAPGLAGTWHARLPGLLRIPIDHAYASGGVSLVRRTALESTGSDHVPIVVSARLPAR